MTLQMLDALWRQVIANNAQYVEPVTGGSSASGTCPASLPTRLVVGQTGHVTPGSPNNLRAGASSSTEKIGEIPGGGAFTVLSGPICSNGLNYWQVSYNGQSGWTAEGRDGAYWLEPG